MSATLPVRRRPRSARGPLLSLAGFLVAAVFLAPYAVMVLDALRPASDVLATPPSILPRTWSAASFGDVITDTRFLHWLRTSLVVSLASTVVVLLVSVPAAYYAARFRFRGRKAFLLLILVTQMFSPTALVVGIYREWFEATMVNTYLALILTDAAFNLAFAIWILQGFFAAIPREVEEAANLDGCGRMAVLTRILLPLARPGLVTAVIFTFIAAWNEYVVALTLMQDDAKKPLTVGISSYVTGYEQNWDQLFAASVIAIVPVVVLFALIEKHLVAGLTAGSVK
ncbi:carbohydrate ABC transporter membrane protein 2 (CUT1 family) [Motilibacter rhizosphaerae]|uniref:Carbohydrate ABC transporter membrane protein 2 (CUT1 family) n=1 Tax=Motilibacter rhizosphaerae TaxID=598652 RepID=A0A4Q7NSY1_9ACTN|nr:carbohydrate ABC transporter permease [Motilibacter rhizosphaerae]RZS89980.1 carbohydrate ABC transporter membrane protein 2 (CUT1 family) [Motilibacter rhizosphaerae]